MHMIQNTLNESMFSQACSVRGLQPLINILTRIGVKSVRVSVTDVTHFRNVYSGNEAATYTVTRTLGTSLLTERRREMAGQLHSHSYRRATKAGQSILEQAKTVLSTSRTLSQPTKVRLRYKRVDFLGKANRNFQIMVDMLIFIAGR